VEHKIFDLGDFALQKGSVLPDAKLGYVTLGELNAAKDNVVLCPTWFTATPSDTAMWMTGPDRALNPERWFIVIPNHFGAAVSSSPSNTPPPFDRGRFPHASTYDSVVAQHRLLTEELGVERIRLVASWSMGACQSYAWAALHPEMVDAIGPISGSARTANFNKVFLAGNIRAITSDPDWNDGFYGDKPPIKGVKAMAAIYAGWGFSEPFYRQEVFRAFGASNVEEFIDYFWDATRSSSRPTRMTCSRRCGRGGTTISATIRSSAATSTPRWPRSGPGPSSSRPRPTATSRPSTPSTRPAGSPTPSAGGSRRSGATSRPSTPRTRCSSIGR
jgi:homoserine O-acetyltransferase/O-succinyltransferase